MIAFILSLSPSAETIFTLGLVTSTASGVLLFQGQHFYLLAIARACQGISANVIWTAGISLITSAVPSSETGRVMGIITTASAVGELASYGCSGPLYEAYGEKALSITAGALVSFDICVRLLLRKPPSVLVDHENSPLLRPCKQTTAVEESSSTYSNLESMPSTVTDVHSVQDQTEATQKSDHKYAAICLLTNRPFLGLLVGLFVCPVYRSCLEVAIPLYLPTAFNWNTTQVSMALFLLLLPTAFSPIYGHIKDRVGVFWPASVGSLIMVCLFVPLATFQTDTFKNHSIFCVSLVTFGSSMFLVGVTLTSAIPDVLQTLDLEHDSSASGVAFSISRIAIAGGIFAGPMYARSADTLEGWTLMCWTCCGTGVLGAIFLCGTWFSHRNRSARN